MNHVVSAVGSLPYLLLWPGFRLYVWRNYNQRWRTRRKFLKSSFFILLFYDPKGYFTEQVKIPHKKKKKRSFISWPSYLVGSLGISNLKKKSQLNLVFPSENYTSLNISSNVNRADLIWGKEREKQWSTIIWQCNARKLPFLALHWMAIYICILGWAATSVLSSWYWGKPLQIRSEK